MTTVLFTRKNSVYKKLGCNCYDETRNALLFTGHESVICHQPCRAWAKLKGQAKPRPDEKETAHFSIRTVRKNGGIVEHPIYSELWKYYGIRPGQYDGYGILYPISQKWFGHRAEKLTGLYIVGYPELIQFPYTMEQPITTVENMGKAEREATPLDLALFLIQLTEEINYEKAKNQQIA